MKKYDDYKLKELAKEMDISLTGHITEDVDMVRSKYSLEKAETLECPKRELSYDEAYRILEFSKRYKSCDGEDSESSLDEVAISGILVLLAVIAICIVKFLKWPGKWLFIPTLSVITIIASFLLARWNDIFSNYKGWSKLLSDKKISRIVNIWRQLQDVNLITAVLFIVVISLLLTFVLNIIIRKLQRKHAITLANRSKVGRIFLLISSCIYSIYGFLVLNKSTQGTENEWFDIRNIFYYFGFKDKTLLQRTVFHPVYFGENIIFKTKYSYLLIPFLCVMIFTLLFGIMFKKREKISAIISITFPFISYAIYLLACKWEAPSNSQLFYNLNMILFIDISNENYWLIFPITFAIYAIFIGITILSKKKKIYNITRGLSHLVMLLHLVALVIGRGIYIHYYENNCFSLMGAAIKYNYSGIYWRLFFFIIYAICFWSINMMLADLCKGNEGIEKEKKASV